MLDATLEQIVRRLHGVERSHGAKRVHLRRTKVADADCPDFAGAIERPPLLRGFLDRGSWDPANGSGRCRSRPFANGAANPRFPERCGSCWRCGRFAVLPSQSDLGRNHGLLAAAVLGESLADDLFGAAKAIDRRRIDDSDPAIERRMDRADRLGLVGCRPTSSRRSPRFQVRCAII